MLFFAPFFYPDLFSVTQVQVQEVSDADLDAGIFIIVIGFINDIIGRFSILISISTSGTIIGTIVGIITGTYTVGVIVAVIRIIAEALP